MSNKPLVGCIVPVGPNINPAQWMMAIKSITDQDYPLERIVIVQVVRVDDGIPHVVVSCTEPRCELVRFDRVSTDPATTYEQGAVGYEVARRIGCDYLFAMSSNDVLSPTKVSGEVGILERNSDLSVSFGNIVYCDNDMNPLNVCECSFSFDPMSGDGYTNTVPDCAMFRASLLDSVGFSGEYRRASWHVFWLKVFEKYGIDAFANVGDDSYIHRQHNGHLMNNVSLFLEGREKLRDFLNGFGPVVSVSRKSEISLKRTPPQEIGDISLAFFDADRDGKNVIL